MTGCGLEIRISLSSFRYKVFVALTMSRKPNNILCACKHPARMEPASDSTPQAKVKSSLSLPGTSGIHIRAPQSADFPSLQDSISDPRTILEFWLLPCLRPEIRVLPIKCRHMGCAEYKHTQFTTHDTGGGHVTCQGTYHTQWIIGPV